MTCTLKTSYCHFLISLFGHSTPKVQSQVILAEFLSRTGEVTSPKELDKAGISVLLISVGRAINGQRGHRAIMRT